MAVGASASRLKYCRIKDTIQWAAADNIAAACAAIQPQLHEVTVWSREALSHVSVRKSVCTLFSRRVHVLPQPAPVLLLSGQPLRVDDAPRYLGVQFNGRGSRTSTKSLQELAPPWAQSPNSRSTWAAVPRPRPWSSLSTSRLCAPTSSTDRNFGQVHLDDTSAASSPFSALPWLLLLVRGAPLLATLWRLT